MYLNNYKLTVNQMGIAFEGTWCFALGQRVFLPGLVVSICQSTCSNDI